MGKKFSEVEFPCVLTQAVAEAGLAVNLVVLVPLTENMPGGRATKPGDVVRAMNGKSIQVITTFRASYGSEIKLCEIYRLLIQSHFCAHCLADFVVLSLTYFDFFSDIKRFKFRSRNSIFTAFPSI